MTKTALRKQVGRGKFTARNLAEARGVQPVTARQALARLESAGLVERVGTERVLTADGKPSRGRPRTQYRIVSGK